MAELPELMVKITVDASDVEMRKLERSLAYEFATEVITDDSITVWDVDDEVWHDIAACLEFEAPDFADSKRYLELRGLLQVHPTNPNWVRVVDEGEGANDV